MAPYTLYSFSLERSRLTTVYVYASSPLAQQQDLSYIYLCGKGTLPGAMSIVLSVVTHLVRDVYADLKSYIRSASLVGAIIAFGSLAVSRVGAREAV